MRVAGGVLVPDVRATDPFALAESLRARQMSLAARVPALTDAGYELAGGAVRPIDDRPGIIAIYRNRPLDLVVFACNATGVSPSCRARRRFVRIGGVSTPCIASRRTFWCSGRKGRSSWC